MIRVAHQAEASPAFRSMKRLEIYLFPLDWMLVHRRLPPALNSSVPIYTPGWREALWEVSVSPMNTTQCPLPGLEPGPLDPESSTLHEPTAPPRKWMIMVLKLMKGELHWSHKARRIRMLSNLTKLYDIRGLRSQYANALEWHRGGKKQRYTLLWTYRQYINCTIITHPC